MTPVGSAFARRRKVVVAATLILGFSAAVAIWIAAGTGGTNSLGNPADSSKKYLREMEVYGGKANLMATDVREWFDSLWHGRRLAVTVAVLSLLLAGFLFLALTPLPPPEVAGRPGDPSRRRH